MVALMAESAEVGDALQELLLARRELADVVVDAILTGIPGFGSDPRAARLLDAAARENVSSVVYAVANGTDVETINAPAAGLEHARLLAQREVPVTVLLRAYRLGQTCFLEQVLARLSEHGIDAGQYAVELIRLISTYIDRISEQVTQAYYDERELWVGSKAALRQHWVNQLLTAENPDVAQAEIALRYRLHGWHVAVEAWIDGAGETTGVVGAFDRLVTSLRRVSGVRLEHLLVPVDAFRASIWLPVEDGFAVDAARLEEAIKREGIPVRVALGPRRRGISGFRSSVLTARRVMELSLSAGAAAPVVLDHSAVAPVALVSQDPAELDSFVESVLGALAAPDPKVGLLRETLLAYLECNRSHHLAAQRLHVHRNTVHYRVQKAIDVLGADLEADPLPLHLALAIVRWRGQPS